MKDLSPESAIILLLILTTLFSFNLLPTYSQLEEGESIMIGYSKSYMFPLLDGGRLDFERGEELWGMSLDKPANITLTSPSGRSRIYHLQPLKQTLIKSFKEYDEEGLWTLNSGKHNLTIQLSSGEEPPDNVRLKYKISGDKLIVELTDHDQDAFIIDVEGGGPLIPAGIEVSIKPPFINTSNEQIYGDAIMDLIYPGELTYSGELADRPYTIVMEKLAARIVGKLEGDRLIVNVPELHSVGAGGLIPVRRGEASLKIRYISARQFQLDVGSMEELNNTLRTGEIKVYVVDEVFRQWAGEKVAKSASLNIEEALNKTLRIIESSGREVTLSYSVVPLTSLTFYEKRLHRVIGNVSVVVEGRQAAVKEDKVYILLNDGESALPIPVRGSSTELIVHAYVNNFNFYNGRIEVNKGENHLIPVELPSLRISLFFPNGTPVYEGALKVNNFKMDIANGSASYLLPAGRYSIEFTHNEWVGKTTLDLREDTILQMVLSRKPTIPDILKVMAGMELIILASLSILTIKISRKDFASRPTWIRTSTIGDEISVYTQIQAC